MNSDSEPLQHQFLNWLLTFVVSTDECPSVECEEVYGVDDLLKNTTTLKSGEQKLVQIPQTFQLGEIPTVQERFQAVLKSRLQTHIQNHPPLFPWETELTEYPEYIEQSAIASVPAWGWLAQQSKLNLPIPLPERVLRQLVSKCQDLLTSSLPLGAKLVQAVESFFPDDYQAINDLAGLVLRSPYRSAGTLEQVPSIQSDFSDLLPRQQMALSLIAAKQLLDNLTLFISFTQPVLERELPTSAGNLTLRVKLQSLGTITKLRVEGQLPTTGILRLKGNSTAMAQSAISLHPSVELNLQPSEQIYTLQVELPELDEQPFLFAISVSK
ncbi:MAG TPA: PatU [Nostocaceae cyanobacterium]|nr:PatU [Nostocaceae cyanobacterium]